MILAYECFGDEDVFLFLKDQCRLSLTPYHAGGQGRVVRALWVAGRAEIGMIDEDPGRSHHGLREQAAVVSTTANLQLLRLKNRYLILVKPQLEQCFLQSMRTARLDSQLAQRPEDLHRILSLENSPKHRRFREELTLLHQESKARKLHTFVTELEETVRGLLG